MAESQDQEVIYLVATSANANYGDELIAASWLRFLARYRPDAEVWLDCPQPGVASHFFANLHPNLKTTDAFWRIVWESEGRERDEAIGHVEHRIMHAGSPRYDIAILGLRRATTVHLLGGAHINSTWPHHLGLLTAARKLKELTGARLVATGLGLMPLGEAERVRADLGTFDHASARDQASADAAGIELSSDDSLLGLEGLAGFTDRALASFRDTDVWLNIQSDTADPGALEAAVAAAREFIADPELAGRTVRYLEVIPGIDRIAYDMLKDVIPEEGFVSFLDLWEDGFPAKPGQVWFTTRYHCHLLAAACGAAGTAVEINDDYYRVKHESLLSSGTGWSVTKCGSKEPAAPSYDAEFRVTVGRLHRTKVLEAEKIYPRLAPRPVEAPPVQPARKSRGLLGR